MRQFWEVPDPESHWVSSPRRRGSSKRRWFELQSPMSDVYSGRRPCEERQGWAPERKWGNRFYHFEAVTVTVPLPVVFCWGNLVKEIRSRTSTAPPLALSHAQMLLTLTMCFLEFEFTSYRNLS